MKLASNTTPVTTTPGDTEMYHLSNMSSTVLFQQKDWELEKASVSFLLVRLKRSGLIDIFITTIDFASVSRE